MFVALGALDAHAEEAVGKGHGLLFGLANVASGPEPRHVLALGKILGVLVPMVLRHFLGVIHVRLIWLGSARGQDNAFHDLVVRPVLQYALVHPVVPIAAKIYITRQVLAHADLLWTVALKIIELRGPPRRISRTAQKFINLLMSLLGVLAGEKGFYLVRRRQCAGHVQCHAAQKLLIGGNLTGHNAHLLQFGNDRLVNRRGGFHLGILGTHLIAYRQHHRQRQNAVVIKRNDM